MADGRTERCLFTGSGVALVTPFAGGGVNEPAMRELVRFHLREGTDALVVNGSTGEATTMSPDEQRRSAEIVVDEAARRVPVVVGCGGSDTAAVARLAEAARAAGADVVLVSPPPYNKPPQRGIAEHYRRVIDAADLPCIIYNVPGRTACNVLPETIEALVDADARVVGVKEASGDISQVAELARRVAHRVALYSGNDDQVVPLMALGGMGVISVLANVAPAQTSRMAHAFLEGAVDESRRIQLQLLPLVAALFREPNPMPVKAAVEMLGFDVGPLRLPLVEISDAVRRELREAMAAAGVGGGVGAGAS